ncbi:MAG: FMN-binding protein [Eubacteriales bacterium]|nr:FMN-binding protein [Eubacteriales bacterium]
MKKQQKVLLGVGAVAVVAAAVLSGTMDKKNDIEAAVQSYTAGTYVGTAEGFGGEVVATVTVNGSAIESVELVGDGETPDFGGNALKELAPKFVEANSAEVDAVAGATISSDAAKAAVQQALDQATGKAAAVEETEAETEVETEAAEESADEKYEGGLRMGLATVHSMKKSKDAGEKDGNAQVDSVVAAVIIDQEGRVVECKLDTAQNKMAFTAEGKVVMKDEFKTKRELGDEYGMKAAFAIGKEWYEQADAFEAYVTGKTAKEIEGIAVDDATKPTDADLASGVTVSIGSYQQAVVEAMKNAEEIGTQEGDKLGLAVITNMNKSKDAEADKEGQCQAYSTYMAVSVDADGVITGSLIDASQGTVKFDATGKITSDIESGVKTKRQLGDDYGMRKASAIGKEWYEQADAFEDYMVGKTAEEVAGIAVDADTKPTDADLASSVTMSIGGLQQLAVKASADAQ